MPEELILLWKEDFTVRAYEVDMRGQLTLQSLFNYMQEAAGNHAAALGVSVEQLFRENLTWVLSRVHLQVNRYPHWKQKVTIETWPADKDTFYAIRDFRILDEKGVAIGKASSSWMMIDLKLRKPIPLPASIERLKNQTMGRSLADPFHKLPKVQRIDHEKNFQVRLSDLDINRHVNSVHYIAWALETVPMDIHKAAHLSDVEVTYRAESNYGDRVRSLCQIEKQDGAFQVIHRLEKEEDQRELTRIVTTWKQR